MSPRPGLPRGPNLERSLLLFVYTLTALVSAALLFVVQPLFARMALPLLGGSPAVWNTALLFYQTVLLAGYAYAHFTTTHLAVRGQRIVHLALMAVALIALPIRIGEIGPPSPETSPVLWLLGLMTVAVGLPFFVVSTTGPLLQRWFAGTSHRSAHDPYTLYAASNLGSMLGLLAYPLLMEPHLTLVEQSRGWMLGYGLLVLLFATCAVLAARDARARTAAADARSSSETASLGTLGAMDAREPLGLGRRLRWMLLAFAPSSLMLSVTTHVSMDIAAIPLLWVVPLGIYLLTFILVFASRTLIPHRLILRLLPLALLPLLVVLQSEALHPAPLLICLHLLMLFVGAMACHGELAADRPHPSRLTEFYLWIAIGGALGGVFNALIAPMVFTRVLEYPITLVAVCLLAGPWRSPANEARARVLDVVLPIGFGVAIAAFVLLLAARGFVWNQVGAAVLTSALSFPLLALSRRPIRFGLAVAAVFLTGPGLIADRKDTLHTERSFFGIHRVGLDGHGRFHALFHGTTLHGIEDMRPGHRGEPLGYYARIGPAGDVFDALSRPMPLRHVAVAGLGSGALAAYASPGQDWTFYEIDPAVERIARDPRYFTYLSDSPTHARVVLGDARRSLVNAADARYDLIVLDAYTSDAIPIHLITREALTLYLSRLAPEGVIAFHISNRYFALEPVVAKLAQDAGLACLTRDALVTPEEQRNGIAAAQYVAMARRLEDLRGLARDRHWRPARTRPGMRLWTDDYSSLISVLRKDWR